MKHRLYFIVGGAIVVILFAALLVPLFVNWDDYKGDFERQASLILGHPVRVIGSADAKILPSPSLTFTDVRVGEEGAEPMMTVERFDVTVGLMPLLQGDIRVVSMNLQKPRVRVSADEKGIVDWLRRETPAKPLDPNRVSLAGVQISDGELSYSDARTGVALTFAGITAGVEASSLAGPWRVNGKYIEGGKPVPFDLATGLRLDDGTIRVKAGYSPPQWPLTVSADGVLASDPQAGLSYTGTYAIAEAVPPPEPNQPEAAAEPRWKSEGTFALTRERVVIDKAVLSIGPSSVAGSLTLNFGKEPRFDAAVEARQLDLDRSFGGGPSAPVNVSALAQGFVEKLATLPAPAIPGRIAFNVPTIVLGGAVVQDVSFSVEPGAAGWQVEGFRARLPGQTSVSADGVLTVDREVGFSGTARLSVAQPAVFASWWRGGAQSGLGRTLLAFDIAGETEIAPGRISVSNIDARIGDATISGQFAWSEVERDHHRHLGTDLKADRIDFAQVKALAELFLGRDLSAAGALADSFSIRLAAAAFRLDDELLLKDVAIDAAYANDVLTVVQIGIGDLGGAGLRVTSGRIDGLTTNPRGHLDARIEANSLDGLALVAGRVMPDSGLVQWIGRSAKSMTPASISVKVMAPPQGGESGFGMSIEGTAGRSTFNATAQSAATKIADWRSQNAKVAILLDTPDSAALAQQLGFAAKPVPNDSGAHIDISGSGVPVDGLDTKIVTNFAGLGVEASGKVAIKTGFEPSFTGTFSATTDDLAPAIVTTGLSFPSGGEAIPVGLTGTIVTTGAEATLTWRDGAIGGRAVGGTAKVARLPDETWRLDGDLSIDAVDLGWLAALNLGFAPEPTGDPKVPWSKTSFGAPTYGAVSGKLAVAAQHVSVGEGLDIADAKLTVGLRPQRIDVDLGEGALAGGKVSGGMTVQNVDGSASLSGQFKVADAALDSLVWRQGGAPVATGRVDLSANFEATGGSPAALVASMTGGGVAAIRNGVVHNVNPDSVRRIVRLSDLGEQYTDETLKAAVEEQIDGGSLAFGETDGAFALAGGTARFTGLAAKSGTVEATGTAAIDLNAMTIDSDFKLTFRSDHAGAEGGAPGPVFDLLFRGPLSAPEREVDALPFGSYLNARQAAQMLDQIARNEAERAERQQFALFLQKSREYTAQIERQKKEAEERAAAELARLAESAAAARDLALEVAAAADARAIEVRANAVAAAKEAADLDAQATAAEKKAADGTVVEGMAALRQAANVARDQAASLSTDADAADAFAASARMEAEAKTAVAAAAAEKAGVPVIAVKTKPAPPAPGPKPKPKVSRPLSATSRPLVITP